MTENLNINKGVDELMELLRREVYTPQEAAEVLQVSERVVLKAAYGGELEAVIINGDVVEVTRTNLVAWLKKRQGR